MELGSPLPTGRFSRHFCLLRHVLHNPPRQKQNWAVSLDEADELDTKGERTRILNIGRMETMALVRRQLTRFCRPAAEHPLSALLTLVSINRPLVGLSDSSDSDSGRRI